MPNWTWLMSNSSDDWFYTEENQGEAEFDHKHKIMGWQKIRLNYWLNKWFQIKCPGQNLLKYENIQFKWDLKNIFGFFIG